jgi:2,4-dienoyl-CoA reductase-like NADH-dependent reductase (Old Yellow Enzyme family)
MDSSLATLFSPYQLGPLTLPNRVCIAPTTRQVAHDDGTPTQEMGQYWARRVQGGCGLVITEGVYFADRWNVKGYPHQSGICHQKHVDAWRRITDMIHEEGGMALMQLQHAGRLADPLYLQDGNPPYSASDTQAPGFVIFTDSEEEKALRGWEGPLPHRRYAPARALTLAEIDELAESFARAAQRAIQAGFDGVEVHGANGFLIDNFFNAGVNVRDDEFGGSPTKRANFALLACRKVRDAIGAEKIVTLRLSQDRIDGLHDSFAGGVAEAREIGQALAQAPVDALHWASFGWDDNRDPASDEIIPAVLRAESAKPAGDMIAIGRPLFANPDWAANVRDGKPPAPVPFERKYVIHPAT